MKKVIIMYSVVINPIISPYKRRNPRGLQPARVSESSTYRN